MKFCTECGNKMEPTDKFCRKCGMNSTALGEASAPPSGTRQATATQSPQSKKSPLLPILAGVGAVGVIALCAVMFLGNQGEKQADVGHSSALESPSSGDVATTEPPATAPETQVPTEEVTPEVGPTEETAVEEIAPEMEEITGDLTPAQVEDFLDSILGHWFIVDYEEPLILFLTQEDGYQVNFGHAYSESYVKGPILQEDVKQISETVYMVPVSTFVGTVGDAVHAIVDIEIDIAELSQGRVIFYGYEFEYIHDDLDAFWQEADLIIKERYYR